MSYTGYGDGSSRNVADFVSDEMQADWEEHRDELIAFWKSGEYTTSEISPTACSGFERASPDTLPWAAEYLD